MARLFTCGFEENNFLETMWTALTSTPTIVTTPVHSGTYAMHPETGDLNSNCQKVIEPSKTSGTLKFRFYFRIAVTVTGTEVGIFDVRNDTGGTVAARIFELNNRTLRLLNIITGTSVTSTFALSLDTWYRLELRHLISDTVGELELDIYTGESTTSEETLSITGEDTLPGNVGRVRFGKQDGSGNFSSTLYYDDFAISDEVATELSAFGPAKTFLLKPNGDNTVAWTKDGSAPAATNFEGVDDVPGTPDDDVTYNSKTTNTTDKLDLSNLGAEVTSDADIILVDVYGRQGSNGTSGTRVIDFELWDEADSQSSQMSISADINGWRICDTDEHLVFDAGSRTKANIDSFRVGYSRSIGGSNEIRVTAQWVNVEWIEVAAPADERHQTRHMRQGWGYH